jgi:hypothetical protein
VLRRGGSGVEYGLYGVNCTWGLIKALAAGIEGSAARTECFLRQTAHLQKKTICQFKNSLQK